MIKHKLKSDNNLETDEVYLYVTSADHLEHSEKRRLEISKDNILIWGSGSLFLTEKIGRSEEMSLTTNELRTCT
jgi:hypothetical protein